MEEEKCVSQVQAVGCCYSKYQVMKTGKQERKENVKLSGRGTD